MALRFIDAVEKAFRRLSEMPEIGVLHEFDDPRLAGTRMWPVPKFPRYMIFYHARGEEIRVLRMLHGARDIAAIFDAGDS